MTLRVPLTLTIIPALTVSIGRPAFRHPALGDRGDRSRQRRIRSRSSSSAAPASRPSAAAACPKSRLPTSSACRARSPKPIAALIVLRPSGGDVYALSVDRIHDHEELVVKPAAPAVMATGLYAGTTLADDGSPILLFDAGRARRRSAASSSKRRSALRASPKGLRRPSSRRPPVLLFRGLDGGRRALRLAVVDRIEEVPASAIKEARVSFGSRSARRSCRSRERRATEIAGDKVRLFRLNDGTQRDRLCFRAKSSTSRPSTMTSFHAEQPGEVSGVSLINGEPAEIVDAHWLFANHVGAAARRRPSNSSAGCPATIPWMQNMLRPIVEAAGYRVVGDGDEPGRPGDRVARRAKSPTMPPSRRSGCAPRPRPPARRTTASIATTARAC